MVSLRLELFPFQSDQVPGAVNVFKPGSAGVVIEPAGIDLFDVFVHFPCQGKNTERFAAFLRIGDDGVEGGFQATFAQGIHIAGLFPAGKEPDEEKPACEGVSSLVFGRPGDVGERKVAVPERAFLQERIDDLSLGEGDVLKIEHNL